MPIIYHEGQTFLEYIHSNVDVINDAPPQEPFSWRYHNGMEYNVITTLAANHVEFNAAIQQLHDDICREDVFAAYQRSYYDGVVATLIWGGQHKSYPWYFRDSINEGLDNINTRIERVNTILEQGNILGAYHSMLRHKSNHISGISDVYISKILYYLTSHDGFQHSIKPLIFDQFLQNSHCSILIDSAAIDHKNYYCIKNGKLSLADSCSEIAYFDYISRLHSICEEFGIISPDKLEMALFEDTGIDDNNNPRFVSKRYALEHFND